MKASKIPETCSNLTLYVLGGLTLLMIVLFIVGFGDSNSLTPDQIGGLEDWEQDLVNGKDLSTSTYLGMFMYFMYGLGAVAIVAAVISAIMSSVNGASLHTEDKKISLVSNLLGWGLLIAAVIVGWFMGAGAVEFIGNDGTVTSAVMVQVTEMFIWSIYILSGVAIIGALLSMTGILKK